jgi:alanine dehydrogenase
MAAIGVLRLPSVETLILSQADVRQLLSVEVSLAAVERAFAVHGRGEAIMPPFVDVVLPHHHGHFRAMPAYIGGSVGVKWVNSHPENPKRHGLPAVRAVYILNDPSTASPLAIMDATLLTAHRTGAAAAIATKYLAKEPTTLGLVGCGAQSRQIVEAHRALFPEIELRCADVARRAAERLAASFGGKAVSLSEAAACEVVCTITPSDIPLVRREWISDNAHVNAMGADAPGKRELDVRILQDARLFVDDQEQAVRGGEINVPVAKGELSPDHVYATLGELVAGRITGSKDPAITVFDSTGLAIQDTALARAVYEAARDAGLGTPVEITG